MIGEYERAFYGDQFDAVLNTLQAQGIQLWLPEADGPVNLKDPVHQALMLLLGSQSRREVLRARHRVLAAMHIQARVQGRFLGGRPPYGYRLADAAPTRIAPTRAGVAACTASNPIRPPHRGCDGSSSNEPPDAASPASPGS